MTPEQAAALRAPFPPESVGKLPPSNNRPPLDYVGHAAVCDRLLQVDPEWTWEPPTVDELHRLPVGDGMWIKLTVCGVTRFGFGDGKNTKEWISDAIRNAAMRFGVALDLWSKEDLSPSLHSGEHPVPAETDSGAVPGPTVGPAKSEVPKAQREKLKRRCAELVAAGVGVADQREARGLPLVDSCDELQFQTFTTMVDELFAELEKPFIYDGALAET